MPTFDHGYALLVGVGADLTVTLRDAERVANLLRDPLRCGYRESNVRLLLGADANRLKLENGLAWLAQCAQDDPLATVVFYYSGHGLAEPAATLVLNPCIGSDGKLIPDRCTTEGFPGNELCKAFLEVTAKKLIVLLDCCHAAAQAEDFKEAPSDPDFLDRLQQGAGRVVLASSSSEEKSRADRRESFFTAALLEGLAGYGSLSRDGYAKVFDIVDYVQRQVRLRTLEKQHPIFKGMAGENFPIAYYAGGEASPRDLSPAVPLPRMPTRWETEAERAFVKDLEHAREEARMVENEIANCGSYDRAPFYLKARRRELDHEIFQIEAKLGLLEQQAPFFQQISKWWGKAGAFTFFASLLCMMGTQKSFNNFISTSPATFALLGLVLSGIGLFILIALTEFFQDEATRGDWYYRLPVAFDFRTVFFVPAFARIFQFLALLLFFAIPLYCQAHFLRKVGEETIYWTARDKQEEQVNLNIRGWDHLARRFPFEESVIDGWYWLGKKGEGISFYPFWGPWFLVILYLAWLAAFVRIVLRLARLDDGRPYFPGLYSAHWHGLVPSGRLYSDGPSFSRNQPLP